MSLVVPPYPPARYTKDEPEVSAWLRRGTDPPDYDAFGGPMKYHYLANQQQTGGDYGLYRVDISPAGGGPGPALPPRDVRGVLRACRGRSGFTTATTGSTGIQGDFLYVPPGGIHGFRNEADEPASFLMLFAPGAPREALLRGPGPVGRAHRRRSRRVVHQERQLLREPDTTATTRREMRGVTPCARLLPISGSFGCGLIAAPGTQALRSWQRRALLRSTACRDSRHAGPPPSPTWRPGRRRPRQRTAGACRADQALRDPRRGLAARFRRVDASPSKKSANSETHH